MSLHFFHPPDFFFGEHQVGVIYHFHFGGFRHFAVFTAFKPWSVREDHESEVLCAITQDKWSLRCVVDFHKLIRSGGPSGYDRGLYLGSTRAFDPVFFVNDSCEVVFVIEYIDFSAFPSLWLVAVDGEARARGVVALCLILIYARVFCDRKPGCFVAFPDFLHLIECFSVVYYGGGVVHVSIRDRVG